MIGLVGIFIVGAGIWYYSSNPKTANTTPIASTVIAATDSNSKVADTSKVQTPIAVTGKNTAATASIDTTHAESAVLATKASAPASTASQNNGLTKSNLTYKIPVTFKQGSSAFRKVNQSLVKQVISYLSKHPAASIHVDGYASSDGALEINQTISQARADAFKKYLVSKDVAARRVVAIGKGIENPIASNNTNAGRQKNRRVEIILQ